MLTYFLQVSLCWLVFYGLYYSLLSRETFFRLNRIYLIISLLCGLMAPFGQVFIEVENASPTVIMLETFVVTAKSLQTKLSSDTEGVLSLRFLLQLIYGLGVGAMTVRFLVGLFKILRIYKKGKKELQNGFTLVHIEGVHLPFSLFNWIFVNENVLDKQDIPQIIEHEKAHVQQGHSFDVIFIEMLKIIFWWNPIIYFYRHSLRNIHEYLADAAVLEGVEKPVYGRLLIKQSQSGPALALANHFIFSQLKKRIIMMTRNRSQRASLLKYVIAFPLFSVLLTLFAIPNNEIMAKTKDLGDKVEVKVNTIDKATNPQSDAPKPVKVISDSAKPLLNQDYIAQELKQSRNLYDVPPTIQPNETIRSTMPPERQRHNPIVANDTIKDDVMTVVEEVPQFPGGMQELFKWLGENIKYPKNARENGDEGTAYIGFVIEKDGSISNISVKKSAKQTSIDTIQQIDPVTYVSKTKIVQNIRGEDLDDEAIRVIAIMPKWKPGKHKGKVVRVAYTLPIKFKLS